MTPDDLYRNGLGDVPTEAILRLAEHVLDLAAEAGIESDDRPRLALAMLKRGETIDGARLATRVWKQALRKPAKGRETSWWHALTTARFTAVLVHERRARDRSSGPSECSGTASGAVAQRTITFARCW